MHIMLGWVACHTRTQQRNQKSNKKKAQLLVKKPCRKDGGTHIGSPVFEARFLDRKMGLVFRTRTMDHKTIVGLKTPGSEYVHLPRGEGGMM